MGEGAEEVIELYFDSLHHYERFRIQHLAEITLCFGSRILNVEKTVVQTHFCVYRNYPEDKVETVTMENNPEDPESGVHEMPFSRTIFIERDDFMENPPKKFFRLAPGTEARWNWNLAPASALRAMKGSTLTPCTTTSDSGFSISRKSCGAPCSLVSRS